MAVKMEKFNARKKIEQSRGSSQLTAGTLSEDGADFEDDFFAFLGPFASSDDLNQTPIN